MVLAVQVGARPVWARLERGLFMLGLVLLLHPVFSSRFYWTLDGPSHAYNASLLRDLMLGAAPAERTWEFNPLPVPNSIGHVLLAIFLIPFEAPEALKLLHVLLLVALPCVLRAIAKQGGAIPWTAHLGFPFVVALPFVMGYYNFYLGVVLLFASIWQWQRIERMGSTWRWIQLSIVLLFLYFAHVLPFLLALSWIGLHIGGALLQDRRKRAISTWTSVRLFRNCAFAAAPALACMAWYYSASAHYPSPDDIPDIDRFEQLRSPFVYASPKEEMIMWWVALALFPITIWLGRLRRSSNDRLSHLGPRLLFLLALVLLFCFSADAYGKGGGVLMRIAWIIPVAIVALLPPMRRWPIAPALVSVVSLVILTGQTIVRKELHEKRTLALRTAYEAARTIPGGTTVAVLHLSWEHTHEAELGLIDRNILIRSNYELAHDHFPLHSKPTVRQHAAELPSDPLDNIAYDSNLRGAELHECDRVILVDKPWTDPEKETVALLDHELASSHDVLEVVGLARVYVRREAHTQDR